MKLRRAQTALCLLLCWPTFSAGQDIPGTARSMYYGNVPITSEPHGGGFRLKDTQRRIYVRDRKFTNTEHEVVSASANWTDRATLTNLNITAFGNAWQDSEDPGGPGGGPDVEISIISSTGSVLRRIGPIAIPPQPFVLALRQYNLTVSGTGNRLLVIDQDLVGADTLIYSVIPSTANSGYSIGGWPNGIAGTVELIAGDAAIDVYWGLVQAYNFYENRFNWTPSASLLGLGLPTCPLGSSSRVDGFVNDPDISSNGADADPVCNDVRFGMGVTYPEEFANVSLDIVAHEYTHLVVDMNSTINNSPAAVEASALNESFADIMGAAVERHVQQLGSVTFPLNTDNWVIGEHVFPNAGYERSLRDPLVSFYRNPDWYLALSEGKYHELGGVQNRWFYLLVNGGPVSVDGVPYVIDPIGWDDALDICFRTMTDKLFTLTRQLPNYHDAVAMSIESAMELFPGTGHVQSVITAWHAVGLHPAPSVFCPGSATWVSSSGSFGDGSAGMDYGNSVDCSWRIQPSGATQIALNFTSFSLAAQDTLYVHAGESAAAPIIGRYSGSALPPAIVHQGGALFVRFLTNASGTAAGWNLTYNSNVDGYCINPESPLNAASGSFEDGSGSNDYSSNTQCSWYITPPGATSVTLSFSQFQTESNADFVKVYGSLDTSLPPITTLSGTSVPGPVVSPTGQMFITFTSNSSTNLAGWAASYISTGGGYCGNDVLTASGGTFTDGSGSASYYNNTHCSWLIQPVGASAVQLEFSSFLVESASTAGIVYDRVIVRDGATASSPIIGTYYGSTIPGTTTSSGPSMYVEFITDNATVAAGWEANYTSLTGTTCSGTTYLTSATGALSDGSGAGDYGNNATCNWLIQPENAVSIQLTFDAFSTQLNADGVIVYDGPNTSSPVLGTYTGSTLPPTLSTSGGAMLVRFVSDAATTGAGFDAHYIANISPAGALALIGYEYWFDEGSATYQSITPTYQYMMDREVDTDGLGSGLHTLHVRFKDNQGSWSSVLSQSFYKALGVPGSTPLLAEWEYWFDDGYDAAIVGALSETQEVVINGLDGEGLPDGLHTAHMRFRGSGGWNSVLSQSFYKAPSSSSGNATINGYEYWFDDDVATLVSASVSPTAQFSLTDAMDAADLPNGLHTMHIRFQGDGGWSSVLSQSFFKSGNANSLTNLVDGYRYWFDDQEVDMETVVLNTPLSPHTLNSPINAQGLSVGQHVLHIQFRDLGGSWSSVLSQSFERVATPSVLVPIRMFLEGPFDPTPLLMNDALRVAGLVPTDEPYTALGFDHVGEGGGESISPTVLSVSGSNAIVDWVFVEVRDNVLNNLVLNTRCALVQRDGDVVDVDGVSPLSMDLAPGDYYIVVRHRNHLGTMTANTVTLSSATGLIDFTSTTLPNYGAEGQKVVAGKRMLWAGNSTSDDRLKYTGADNDRDLILVRIGGSISTATTSGYYQEDITMDGIVKYTGALNDRDPILVNIGGVIATQVRFEQLP